MAIFERPTLEGSDESCCNRCGTYMVFGPDALGGGASVNDCSAVRWACERSVGPVGPSGQSPVAVGEYVNGVIEPK